MNSKTGTPIRLILISFSDSRRKFLLGRFRETEIDTLNCSWKDFSEVCAISLPFRRLTHRNGDDLHALCNWQQMFTHVLSAPPDTSHRTNLKHFINRFVIPFFISSQLASTLHELLPIENKNSPLLATSAKFSHKNQQTGDACTVERKVSSCAM